MEILVKIEKKLVVKIIAVISVILFIVAFGVLSPTFGNKITRVSHTSRNDISIGRINFNCEIHTKGKHMKIKQVFMVLLGGTVTLLSGCASQSNENGESVRFEKSDVQKYCSVEEYNISEIDQPIIVHFPTVTNKEITGTELGGVATYMPPGDIGKVTLKPETQDRLNEKCDDYYISFLKYRVMIEDIDSLKINDRLELCDTKIWIYHNAEFETVTVDSIYLKINIVGEKDDASIPDWTAVNNSISAQIKSNLLETAI